MFLGLTFLLPNRKSGTIPKHQTRRFEFTYAGLVDSCFGQVWSPALDGDCADWRCSFPSLRVNPATRPMGRKSDHQNFRAGERVRQ